MSTPDSLSSLSTASSDRQRKILLALSLLLIACNLRPVFGSLSVVLPEIMRDTGLSAAGASLLTTLPILCLGLFSAPTPWLSRRFGAERVLLLALLLIGTGTLLRAAGSLPFLFASAVLAGAGIAMGNVLLPSLVKRHFARHAALMTGMYILAICIGATIATASTVPLATNLFDGAWPYALAVWALPALLVLALWLPQALRMHTEPTDAAARAGSLGRDPLAWQVTAFMGLQSSLAYIVIGWLAPILRERGLESDMAGYVVAITTLSQLVTSLVVPSIAARCRDQRALAVGLTALAFAALMGLILAPLASVWLWALLLGCGQGGLFALALSLIVMRSGNAQVTAQLSAMAQGWGYMLAAFGPLLTGLLHQWTGSFASSIWLIALLSAAMAWSGWGAGRNLLVRPGTR
ncbi:MFS transporter [Acidovorax sp. CCYZU-2555]|uniref:CynX/NimT family MFS transporter n=1 Tax=Acidovorax sp. CCYZU-2555 TaxID=2835042 RepID=UPI0020BF2109|nr:MFS transporter [Acidovorax sp. CCYZU-2555]